ncbi:toprim domain-containing protein [Desulfovibrio subterraneus]|uniref:toprim domain-containing protein n=1 Tax=Desulfovibrio subterraneus TaxID=2718620 RepID=UPI0022B86126|nr:toprim domain-containing protein [Desulfovibrio subterraneus]WBF68281.1 toprim domain-containing protein [Desulfovibrio subterraneus]
MSGFDIPARDVVQALLADPRFQLKERGGYLRGGPCPGCGRNELFISMEKPWVMKCSRANKCAWEEPVRELLPELFENFVDRYPPTEAEPDRTANVYLGMNRGFDLSKIRGWYDQGTYQYPHSSYFTPTVRFYLDKEKNIYWQRLIKPLADAQNKGKARFNGDYKGMVWAPPTLTIEKGDRVFIVEGIFHAIALYHVGIKAVAALSSSNFPDAFIEAHRDKKVCWVLALDGDKAGADYTKRHAAKLQVLQQRYEVCRLPGKQDWDDLFRAGRITDKFISDCMYYGRLFMSETANEKAYHYYVRHESKYFIIDFENQLYRVEAGQKLSEALETAAITRRNKAEEEGDEDGAAKESIAALRRAILESPRGWDMFLQHADLDQIANVYPECLYHEADELVESKQFYVFRINYPRKAPVIVKLEGTYLTSSLNFSSALINKAPGAEFSGTNGDFLYLRKKWMDIAQDRNIRMVQYMGYVKALNAYVYENRAYHKGKEIPLNQDGFFQVGKHGVRPHLRGVHIHTDGAFNPDWLEDYIRVFHWQGLALLAFWLGSLFAQQIREAQKSYPFFELTGEPGAGKSTVLEFLWKCCGRDDYEGLDLLKATDAGRRRAFSQLSNLPIVLIESDRDDGRKDGRSRQFDFDHCKAFYNGRGTGARGVNNSGNEVDESLFQASLVIAQNAEVGGSDALLERIVHCHADKHHHGSGTRELARWFERQTVESVGGFLRTALRSEQRILEVYFAAFERFERQFTPHIKSERVNKNHAQVAAAGAALSVLFPQMTEQRVALLGDYLMERAQTRMERLASDHPLVEDFWETFHYLNSETRTRKHGWLNHSKDENLIVLHLKEVAAACRDEGLPAPDLLQLKRLLMHSNKHKLVAKNKTYRSRWTGASARYWHFSS